MRSQRTANPPRSSRERLGRDRQSALEAFVRERGREGTQAYREAFRSLEPAVRRIFEVTHDLRDFSEEVLVDNVELLDAARYLAVPPMSEDDLRTLAGERMSGGRLNREVAAKVVAVLRACMDPIRLSWLSEERPARESEREQAVSWTTSIWAIERVRTFRRTTSSRRQEEAVVALLTASGYRREPARRRIDSLDDLARGSFCREAILAGSKCDVPVCLFDGRLLALECKVSNSALNSVKRLLRETGGKARVWNEEFGRKIITGAVLAGVFKLSDLMKAQDDHGITIFWEHDLRRLRTFISH